MDARRVEALRAVGVEHDRRGQHHRLLLRPPPAGYHAEDDHLRGDALGARSRGRLSAAGQAADDRT